jgi:CheY-like chemotaxis protein
VEVLAEALHGSSQHYLRIDCGEFQLDHEVAKLIGSPPGYLGHRETVPVLSPERLSEVVTPDCDISLVLFDEIEKAAPSMSRLLLGVLDKGRLTLGDNSAVQFDHSLLFFTSNLGAREMMREMNPGFGFEVVSDAPKNMEEAATKLESIALAAVRKTFSPEFLNRIDVVLTYRPLTTEALDLILSQQVTELQEHIHRRLGARAFSIDVRRSAREFLLGRGASIDYGARELKRTVYRFLTQPLATMVAEDLIRAGSTISIEADADGEKLALRPEPIVVPQISTEAPAVLIVDDNEGLLKLLTATFAREKWVIVPASTAAEAIHLARQTHFDLALIDYLLPDLDGASLSKRLREQFPELKIIMMTGSEIVSVEKDMNLPAETPLIQKPFLIQDVLVLMRSRLGPADSPKASRATTNRG